MRYLATRLHGDGTETVVADELPLSNVLVGRALSGAGSLTARVTVEVPRLAGLFMPGRTAVYALSDHGAVLGGGIVTPQTFREGPMLALDCQGHAGYLRSQPYDGNRQWIQVDPAHLFRHAWAHVQGRPHQDLGVVVDSTSTPVRIGTEEEEVEFETRAGERVDFTAGPVKWNYWTTDDLGRVTDQLAESTPFDYYMAHRWDAGQSTVRHRLRVGYPTLGTRREALSFVVGVNVIDEPSVGYGDDVSAVLVVGAGEGSEARRGRASRNPGGLGRTVMVTDRTLTTNQACAALAQRLVDQMSGRDNVERLRVIDHPNAPLGSWHPGDEIRVQGNGTGWAGDLDRWARVLSDETDPATGQAILTVQVGG